MRRFKRRSESLEDEPGPESATKLHPIGTIVGTMTGETDRDTVASGWEGTDDATSTAPSDLDSSGIPEIRAEGPEEEAIDGYEECLKRAIPTSDIKGSPVDESRNWERESYSEK